MADTNANEWKLEDLLENSEKIAASLKKQKNQLEKEIDIARRETDVIRKSFQSLRMKYKKSSNICQIYKKKLWETNEEKAVLQSQIQEYVGRVRHIEEMLLQKEQEREFVFQQFQELSAKDNCGDNFLEMIDNREDPSRDGTPNSFADTIFVANAETQTAALRKIKPSFSKDGAGERCSYESTDFVEGMAHQTKSSSKEYIAFESTLPEPSKATSKDGLPTNQLDVVGKTFSRLESQMKMIGQSFDRCQTNCISREGRASRQYIADSSLSTML